MPRFTKTKKEAYLRYLRDGMRRGIAAQAVGVSRETVRLHYNRYESFRKAVEVAELEANEAVEDALYQAALAGNVVACQVWLYNRMPDRWADKRNLRLQHSGEGGGPLTIEVVYVNKPRQTDEEDSAD